MKRISTCLFIVIPLFLTVVVKAQQTEQGRDLSFYLSQARAASPVLKDFENQRRSLGIDSLLARTAARPQVTANSAGMYAPTFKGYGFDEVLTNGQSLEALLTVNYDLLNKGRIQNQLKGIRIQRDSVQYASQLSLLDLSRSVTDQYITAYWSQEQIGFNREIIQLLQKEERLLKQLTRDNIYKQSEYLTFLVTLQQQQLVLKQAELQFKNDFALLNYLAGVADTTEVHLPVPDIKADMTVKEASFFTKRFEIDSLKNQNQKAAINFNYRPKLGLYANGGYNSSLSLQPYKNFGTSAGFTLSIPVYDGHQRKMQFSKLDLSSRTITGYRDFFIRQQGQQINLIRQQLFQTDGLFAKINDQIRFSKGLIEADSKLLHTGDLKIADFVIAINNYLSVQNLWKQTSINRLKLINQLNYWNR